MMGLSDYIPLNLICLGLLGALGLRRLVRMEGYHWLRVVLLTGLLWLPVIYLFLSVIDRMLLPTIFCGNDPNAYTITEM